MSKRKPVKISKNTRFIIKPTVIILGEGVTEKDYIDLLKELNYFNNVHLKYERGDEENFETKLKEHSNPNVLVVLDIDNVQSGTSKFNTIQRLVTTKKFKNKVFFNNYSFEIWLLNHLVYFTSPIVAKKEYDSSMKSQFGVKHWSSNKGSSNRKSVMNQINKKGVNAAKKNIGILNNKNPFHNPSSNMDDLITKIASIK